MEWIRYIGVWHRSIYSDFMEITSDRYVIKSPYLYKTLTFESVWSGTTYQCQLLLYRNGPSRHASWNESYINFDEFVFDILNLPKFSSDYSIFITKFDTRNLQAVDIYSDDSLVEELTKHILSTCNPIL